MTTKRNSSSASSNTSADRSVGIPPKAGSDADRQMYPAKCATCEADIQVPFKPDASRPTFCKDCLKDYQRQQARVQQTKGAREEKPIRRSSVSSRSEADRPRQTLTMSEATRMQPRNFRRENTREKKQVDLAGVRSLIKESIDSKK